MASSAICMHMLFVIIIQEQDSFSQAYSALQMSLENSFKAKVELKRFHIIEKLCRIGCLYCDIELEGQKFRNLLYNNRDANCFSIKLTCRKG